MGKYDGLTKAKLDKQYKAHLKKKKSRPSEQKYQEKDRKIKESINSYKLRLAELKYENDQIRKKTDTYLQKQNEMREELKQAQGVLDGYKSERSNVAKELNDMLGDSSGKGPRRIKDPHVKLQDYQAKLRSERNHLVGGEITTGEEKKIMRNIKILEKNIQEVETYIKSNAEDVFVKKDQKQKKVDEFRGQHQKVFEKFDQAKKEATAQFEQLDANKEQQTDIQNLISKLLDQRKDAENEYKASWDAYEQWQRTEREMKIALNAKQYDDDLEDASDRSAAKKPETKSAEAKKEADAEKQNRVKAEEQLQSVEDRRAAAVAAYKQCRDNLKKKSTMAPVAGGEDVADVPEVSQKQDPHQVEKDLCRSLIAYCRSNLPGGEKQSNDNSPAKGRKKKRKKKKKIRLTHKPINFSNFAKVGVGIPIWSTDLEECIKSLESKITSYDDPDAQEEDVPADTSI